MKHMSSNANLRLTEFSFQDNTLLAQLSPSNDATGGADHLIERVELLEIIVNSFPGGISVFDEELEDGAMQ